MNPLYDCIVMGASSGGLQALFSVLGALPPDYPLPILVAQHLLPHQPSELAAALAARLHLHVHEACDKRLLRAGEICVAVPDYHLLVERDDVAGARQYCVGLSQEPPECFSRPAINPLFESAAVSTGGRVVGVILTGANDDGARGAACLKRWGGHLIVQDPSSAECESMPRATLAVADADMIGNTSEIGSYLLQLGAGNECSS